MFQRRIRVFYPPGSGAMVLRTANNWQRDLEPIAVAPDEGRSEFDVTAEHSSLELKPCLRDGDRFLWSEGTNKLAILSATGPRDIYPYFGRAGRSRITPRRRFVAQALGRALEIRVYLPPGYRENTLKRFPVIYMHDGRNLFFPEEAYLGREWQVDETLDRLDTMNIIDQVIVVGLHTTSRMQDYTRPGYEPFGRALVDEIKPAIDAEFRTLPEPRWTSVMGSSLGGVVSFYLAWQWPEVFGNAACLSSTFGYQDDLIHRVRNEPSTAHRHQRFYLDSGWPRDNYQATLGMAHALKEAGFEFGRQFLHFAFPLAQHHEAAWAARSHLPIQLFSGRLAISEPLRSPNPSQDGGDPSTLDS